jgi:RNA polymerase sigma-70 factor (ECF subfamily)
MTAMEVVLEPSSRIEEIYRAEGTRLWRSVMGFAGNREITDDAVSEAFTQLLSRGGEVRDPVAWVWRAAFRIAAGELKRRSRGVPQIAELAVEPTDPIDDVLAALAKLPSRQRAVVILHDYADWSSSKVASIYGIRQTTVRVHLSEGRKRLRAILEEEDG